MLNQMVKWTVIISLWRTYKRHVSATFFLLLALLLITLFHQDFVEFSEKSDSSYLALSYVVKWAAYVISVLLYMVAIKKINASATFDSTLHAMMNAKSSDKEIRKRDFDKSVDDSEPKQSDPFEHLRNKKSLRSKADFIIDADQDR